MSVISIQKLKAKLIYIICPCVIVLSLQCRSKTDQTISGDTVAQIQVRQPAIDEVSLLSLANNPDKYNGRPVSVKGFLQLAFEGNIIFSSKDAYEQGTDSNFLSIDITRKQMDSTFHHFNKTDVVIDGIFDMNNKGHMNGFRGSLINISNIKAAQ